MSEKQLNTNGRLARRRVDAVPRGVGSATVIYAARAEGLDILEAALVAKAQGA